MPVALDMSNIFKLFENEIRYAKLSKISSGLSRMNVVVLVGVAISMTQLKSDDVVYGLQDVEFQVAENEI